MRHAIFVIGAIALATIAVAAAPPKLGPEWTEDKEAQNYFKMTPIRVTRSAGGNTRNYHLDLEHDKVRVTDTDGNIATGVTVSGTVGLDVRKDSKGRPGSVSAVINKSTYHDLDCDGVWDAWDDSRNGDHRRSIWCNGAWVRVCDFLGGFDNGVRAVLSLDRQTEYVWDGKAWQGRPANR